MALSTESTAALRKLRQITRRMRAHLERRGGARRDQGNAHWLLMREITYKSIGLRVSGSLGAGVSDRIDGVEVGCGGARARVGWAVVGGRTPLFTSSAAINKVNGWSIALDAYKT